MKKYNVTGLFLLLALCLSTAHATEPTYASNGMTDASPSEVYLRYEQVLADLQSLKQLLPYSSRSLAANRKQLASIPPEKIGKLITSMRAMAVQDIEIIDQSIDGDTATLKARGRSIGLFTGEPEDVWGTIDMVRKGGEWKVKNSNWRDTKTSQQ